MPQITISTEELGPVAQELFLLIPAAILVGASALRVRSEVGEGHGSTDMYVLYDDKSIRHLLNERDLLRTLFEKLYSLPTQLDGTCCAWNVAVIRWSRGGIANLSLTEEPIANRAQTAGRRSAWEKAEFEQHAIERVDPFG
jgi:hypothetical protein